MIKHQFDCEGCERWVFCQFDGSPKAFEFPCGEVTMLTEDNKAQ